MSLLSPEIRGQRTELIDGDALFGALCREDVLARAWAKVHSNRGAGGGDGVRIGAYAMQWKANNRALIADLACKRYEPGPIRVCDIPKSGENGSAGETRRLAIPCIRDRILQTGVAMLLGPPLEDEFEDSSFAYRPGRSVQQAVARVQLLHATGYRHVVDADIEGFFDAVDHDLLLSRLGQSVKPGLLTGLISLWLAHAMPMGQGLAQGSPLSPLLANLFLDRIDEAFAAGNVRIVRYADDFLILVKQAPGAAEALARVRTLLAQQGLRLNAQKTRVTSFEDGFRFLGHRFVRSLAIPAKAYARESEEIGALMRRIAEEDERASTEPVAMDEDSLSAKGYAPGHRTLHVLGKDRRLNVRNQAFTVEERQPAGEQDEWRELIAIPHQRVDRIDIGPLAGLGPRALEHVVTTRTLCSLVDGHGVTRAQIAPVMAPRAARHLAQASTALDQRRRLELAQILVVGRLRSQRSLLRKLLYGRDVKPPVVTAAIGVLNDLIGRGDAGPVDRADSVDMAMGYEGYGTAKFWPALAALANSAIGFDGQRRRSNPDPGNIALNFLAWLLHRDVGAAVLQAGLHPGFGCLHTINDRHDACVYDLMEEFRCYFVEGLYCYVSSRAILRPEMFFRSGRHWRLGSEGATALVRAYENRMHGNARKSKGKTFSYGKLLINQAQLLAAHFEGRALYAPHEASY